MKLNKEIAQDYAKVLLQANTQWFYGYHFSEEDLKELKEAMDYFSKVTIELEVRVQKEK